MYVIERRELVWTNQGPATEIAPDAPDASWTADITDVEDIYVQVDTTATLNTASSVDLNFTVGVLGEDKAVVWDTAAGQEITAQADGVIKTTAVTLRGDRLKLSLDNNTGASKAYVTVIMRIRRRRY